MSPTMAVWSGRVLASHSFVAKFSATTYRLLVWERVYVRVHEAE